MKELLRAVESLKKSSTRVLIEKRIQEFKKINRQSSDELFKELCFCILTANFNAERSIQIHQQLNKCFLTDSKDTLGKKLRQCGYRFPNTRARYISASLLKKDQLQIIIHTLTGEELREWLVKNIKGLGYKESSHFLRNIGFDDYAIIDSHILELLDRYKVIKQPKTLTRKKYLEIENVLQKIAHRVDLTLAKLDLYLWYMETGKILK
jgi:N-glycosylase/DNA lyase